MNDRAFDMANLNPMTEQTPANTRQVIADAGYCSADNLEAAGEYAAAHAAAPATLPGQADNFTMPAWRRAANIVGTVQRSNRKPACARAR